MSETKKQELEREMRDLISCEKIAVVDLVEARLVAADADRRWQQAEIRHSAALDKIEAFMRANCIPAKEP